MHPHRKLLAAPPLVACLVAGSWAFASQKGPQKPPASQGAVASKTAHFGSVAKTDSAVKKALNCKDLGGGAKLVGKPAAFTGVVDSVYSPKAGDAVYLDFSNPWKNSLSAHVKAADFAKLPALSGLKGKLVLITGTISLYGKSHPEIVVSSPSQIKLVK